MPLVNSRELLKDAQAHGYAVGAFNVENMEMMQAVVSAAEVESAPLMLQTTPSTLRYANTFDLCRQAAWDRYTSVMIDGSKLPLKENIELHSPEIPLCMTQKFGGSGRDAVTKLVRHRIAVCGAYKCV